MMIAPWMLGGLIGLVLGVSTYVILGRVIHQSDEEGRLEKTHPNRVLEFIRRFDLVFLPVVLAVVFHYFVGGPK